MTQASPKIIAIDIEKAFPDAEDQDRLYPIVPYLDEVGLATLHGFLRTKLVLSVIGHDRRNKDVKNLQERLTTQWKLLEKTIRKLKVAKNGNQTDPRNQALDTLKSGIDKVRH